MIRYIIFKKKKIHNLIYDHVNYCQIKIKHHMSKYTIVKMSTA